MTNCSQMAGSASYPQPSQVSDLRKYSLKLVSKGGLEQPQIVVIWVEFPGAERHEMRSDLRFRELASVRLRTIPSRSACGCLQFARVATPLV